MKNCATTLTRRTMVVEEQIETKTIEQLGYEAAEKVVREYLNIYAFPFMNGDDRDKWVAERLRKIRWRFFEPI